MRTRMILCIISAAMAAAGQPATNPTTFCNPMNLNYHLWGGYREAADPTGLIYNGDYYLFASKSRGYWWSTDLCTWTFVKHTAQTLPDVDGYAPSAWEYNGYLYVTTNDIAGIYRTNNPKSGAAWEKVSSGSLPWDESVFKGFDGNYYCTGSGDQIWQLTPGANFSMNSANHSVNNCASAFNHGWEQEPSQPQTTDGYTGSEGGWIIPFSGKYYFHYSCPGTSADEYADGCQMASAPLGPYTYLNNSPVSCMPTGFFTGGGHGSVFADKTGSCWRLSTLVIAVRAGFERRVGLFPTLFDPDGAIYHDQVMGDYPQYLPGKKPAGAQSNQPGWMLLSYNKPATASSTLSGKSTAGAFDETIKTWWSAATGNAGEWLRADLQKTCTIRAIQVNFAEEGIQNADDEAQLYHAYTIEGSVDNQAWSAIADKTANRTDVPHDYIELSQATNVRYVRITNTHMSGNGKFAIAGLRVFGSANGALPAAVAQPVINRSSTDRRICTVTWRAASGATGYVVRYGTKPAWLYNSYLVRVGKYVDYPANWIKYSIHDTTITVSSLNKTPAYYFRVDAFNETGLATGSAVVSDQNAVSSAFERPARRLTDRETPAEDGAAFDLHGRRLLPADRAAMHRIRGVCVVVAEDGWRGIVAR